MATVIFEVMRENVAKGFKDDYLATSRLLKLAKTNVTVTADKVYSDFLEADFTGYAAADPGTPVYSWDGGGGRALLTFPTVIFTCSGVGAGPQNIFAWWLEFGSGYTGAHSMICGGNFSPTQTMTNPGDEIPVTVVLAFRLP